MASEPTDHSDEQGNEHQSAEADAPVVEQVAAQPDEQSVAPVKKTARKRATKAAASPRRAAKKAVPTAIQESAGDAAEPVDAAEAVATAESVDAVETVAPAEGTDEASGAPAKRTRRPRKTVPPPVADEQPPADESTTEETGEQEAAQGAGEDAEDAGEEVDGTPIAAVPSFGLVFQAPEPMAPRRRRATSAAGAPSQRRADEESDTAQTQEGPGTQGVSGPDAAGGAALEGADGAGSAADDGQDSGPDDQGDGGGGRRSRRRGGRGRRSRGTDAGPADEAGDDSAAQDAGGDASTDEAKPDESGASDGQRRDSAESATDSESADTGTEDSSRRRRRRRRGSSDSESDESRGARAREQVTALRGSTRLEAKKQRRREGREAGRRRQIITEAEFLARRESVERTMVVRERENTTQIGVLEDGVLVEHYVSRETGASMIGNVYLGRVQNVLPSMEAAFVDIGKGRNAVLYAGEVNWDAAGLEGNVPRRIENALTSGDTVLVQVTKDPIGHKGARLTSQVSLPGRFLVYVPEASMTGISRKLPDTERARLKSILKKIVPDDAGVIVRTASEGASEEELTADIERLTKAWERIKTKAERSGKKKGGAPVLLHGEPDLTVKVIRDVFNEDFTSLVVSGDKAYAEISDYVEDVAPELAKRLTKWTGEKDLFAEHRVDEQLAKALDRKVWLPSGGSLVIDRTEAMTVVDVNTGKFVGSGGNLEETVTKNNIEAAEEIVRQLRLRDIGGIIVIDFIDMVLESNRDLVVRRLLECLGRDRTKHQVAEVTSLGLVQMTRKRVGSGLLEVFSEPCSHCAGRGVIVHSDPLDQPTGEDSGNGRGRGRGRGNIGGRDGGDRSGGAPTKPASNGPTAAQIAAAAHAAALKAVAAATTGTEAEEAVATAAAEATAEATEQSAAATESEPRTLEPRPEPAEQSESPVAPAYPSESPVEPAEQSELPVEPQTVAGPQTPSELEPAPARPRRKRGRVVAQAGPPGGSEVRVLTPED